MTEAGEPRLEVSIRNNPGHGRYELEVDGRRVGLADYRELDDVVVISHVEVDPAEQGHGLAAQLTRFTLDDLRAHNKAVWPVCPYVRSWIARHEDYLELVPAGDRSRFGL